MILKSIVFCLLLLVQQVNAQESLVTSAQLASGEVIPYVLNQQGNTPEYVLILFPGGNGIINPHLEDGQLVYGKQTNFLLRVRNLWVDEHFATVSMDSTQVELRIQAVIDDIHRRFAKASIYLVGTSRGTFDTLRLAAYLSDKIAGEIHTSSMQQVSTLNHKDYANRQLIVHHRHDGCRVTPFGAAESAHENYGTQLLVMDGGEGIGDPCEPFGHHGYNGIESETVAAIKQWIKVPAESVSVRSIKD